MKALLKKVEVVGKENVKYEKTLREIDEYMSKVRGILARNNIPYKETGNAIELEQPTEINITKPFGVSWLVRFTYLLRFEDEAEKNVLHKNIDAVMADGTTRVKMEYHTIYLPNLPKNWKDANEVEAIVEVEPYGSSNVMSDVVIALEKELEGLEKTYTVRVTNRMLKVLRDVSAEEVRDVLKRIFVERSHVTVDRYEYESLKEELKYCKDLKKDIEEILKELREKYNTLAEFIKSRGLGEEFVKFIAEKEKEEREEEVKERFSELFREEEE